VAFVIFVVRMAFVKCSSMMNNGQKLLPEEGKLSIVASGVGEKI
jgi:hypothetical protein